VTNWRLSKKIWPTAWSLVRNEDHDGEVGLLPTAYYTVSHFQTLLLAPIYLVFSTAHVDLHVGPRPLNTCICPFHERETNRSIHELCHTPRLTYIYTQTKLLSFRVMVHSPSKRTSTLSGAYTIYSVTSPFHPQPMAESSILHSDLDDMTRPASPTRITVHRRFALTKRLPGIACHPYPRNSMQEDLAMSSSKLELEGGI
jgi:hypothetical protein